MAKIPFEVLAEEDLPSTPLVIDRPFSDKLLASYKRGFDNTPFASIQRLIERSLVDDDKEVSPEILNSKFKDVAKPFTESMSVGKAKLINKQARDTKFLDKIIASGDNTFGEEVILFGTSMLPELIDPINIGTGFGIAQGINKVLGRTLVGLGPSIVEAVTGNVLLDLGVVLPLSRQEQRDVNTYNMLATSVAAGIAFPLAFAGIKRAAGAISNAQSVRKLSLIEARMDNNKKLTSIADEPEGLASPQEIRRVENSVEQDLDYDPKLQQEVEDFDLNPETLQDLTSADELLEGIRDLELDKTQKIALDEFDSAKSNVGEISKLHTLATHCVRNS